MQHVCEKGTLLLEQEHQKQYPPKDVTITDEGK